MIQNLNSETGLASWLYNKVSDVYMFMQILNDNYEQILNDSLIHNKCLL